MALVTDKQMVDDHHNLLTGKAADSAPIALYLTTALLHHVLHPAPPLPPPQPAIGPAPKPIMAHHSLPSQHSERTEAAHTFSATGKLGVHDAPEHYLEHLQQFALDLQSMQDPAFRATLRRIRRDAAYCMWTETRKPDTAAERDRLSNTQLDHRTTAPITACITADDHTQQTDSAPLHYMGRRFMDITAPHSSRIRRSRLLFGRSYVAAVRHRFLSQANVPTANALCPHAMCALRHKDETIEHLLLDCPLYNTAREQLYHTLDTHNLPHTLRSILNPPGNKGRRAFEVLYAATELYLDSINATRLQHNLPSLDHRPPNPLLPHAAAQPAIVLLRRQQPHRPHRRHGAAAPHRRHQLRAVPAASGAPLAYDPG